MKLPNGDRAIIPIEKLLGYCLNPNHQKGKHKARVFKSALGITADNVEQLVQLIELAAVQGEVVQERITDFGQEFKLDWAISEHDDLQALVPLDRMMNSLPSGLILDLSLAKISALCGIFSNKNESRQIDPFAVIHQFFET